jgi:hypothetical protein
VAVDDKIYMTQTAYANFIGVTQALVSRMKRDGRLVFVDGLGIDAAESKKIYEAKSGAFKLSQPNHSAAKKPSKGALTKSNISAIVKSEKEDNESRADAIDRGTIAQADLTENKAKNEQLKYEQTNGELLSRDEVESEFFEFSRGLRDALQNIPSKIAPLICSTLGVKIGKSFDVEQIIAGAIRDELTDMARTPAVLNPRKGQKNGGPLKS